MIRGYNIASLPRPQYVSILEKNNALNSDIISAIENNFPLAVKQTANFSRQFRKSSRMASCRAVWNFLTQQIQYKKDADNNQLVRLPSRFVVDGVGDCKSFSLFTAGILANLGMPVAFRYVSYRLSPIPSHVYCVTQDESGHEIIIDGVWTAFNSQKKFKSKIDHPMNVYSLHGTDNTIGKIRIGKFFSKIGKGVAKGVKNVGKEVGKGAKNIGKEAFKGVKLVGLAPGRRAFRSLVALNVHGLATKLSRMQKRNEPALRKKWASLGGSWGDFLHSINAGAKRKKIFGVGSIGDPVSVASLLALAAPIIAAICGLLKKAGVDSGAEPGESSIDKIENITERAVEMAGGGGGSGGGGYAYEDPTEPANQAKYDTSAGDGFSINPLYLVVGGGLALFLILKKKIK